MRRLAEKLDWPALSETLASVSRNFISNLKQLDWGVVNLPAEFNEAMLEDAKFVSDLHLILVKRQITDGAMKCANC